MLRERGFEYVKVYLFRVGCVMSDDLELRNRSVEYRLKAHNCLLIADTVDSAQSRSQFLVMALAWFHLAEQAEKNSAADPVYETLSGTEGHGA